MLRNESMSDGSTACQAEHAAITTLALRGLSRTYTVETILQILDSATAFRKTFDFLYLPKRGGQPHAGLAIVNFVDEDSCRQCLERLLKMREEGLLKGIKSIGQSYIQGFSRNLAYYAVLATDRRATDSPMIFERGELVADLLPVMQRCVTPQLLQWARQQAEALYDTKADGDLLQLMQLGGRACSPHELERIRVLLGDTWMEPRTAEQFLFFSL
ncbi:Riboflavin biosynthesis protein RibBA [Durusdinium trenchii]|uniref:Riboflavin biosynthesis protein RibBA n=1 Tax=Durusdinium trenchii TaxID=1381693 RepID=A0ABP0MM61_9DINO